MVKKKTDTGARSRANTTIKPRHFADRIGLNQKILRGRAFRKLFPFEPHHVNVNGQNMHFLDEGDGEPVVMLHGNPTWSFFYRRMVGSLSGHFRCLAPDHIGCGFSDKPQKYNYTLDQHIENFSKWVDSVLPPAEWNGGTFNLIVHDWGGPIGMGYAVRYPERINRVVIMNTSAFLAGTMPRSIKLCRFPILGELLVRGFNAFADMATKWTTVKKLHPEVRKAFIMPYNNWANRVGVYRFVQDIPLTPGTPTYDRFRDTQDKLGEALAGKPMLIQWGMKDFCFTPHFLNLWKAKFPDAEVDEYPAGHYLLEDAGSAIVERVRGFLEQPLPVRNDEEPEDEVPEEDESEGDDA